MSPIWRPWAVAVVAVTTVAARTSPPIATLESAGFITTTRSDGADSLRLLLASNDPITARYATAELLENQVPEASGLPRKGDVMLAAPPAVEPYSAVGPGTPAGADASPVADAEVNTPSPPDKV